MRNREGSFENEAGCYLPQLFIVRLSNANEVGQKDSLFPNDDPLLSRIIQRVVQLPE
jgi:hypothetical protein